MHADYILRSKIITLDTQNKIAEAIAISGDRIIAVGDDAAVSALRGPNTKVRSVGGCVIPGFNDTHAHMDTEGLRSCFISLDDAKSIADIQAIIAREAAHKAKGEWIVTMPVGQAPFYFEGPLNLAEKRMPTRYELDSCAPDHPVCILPPSSYWSLIPCYSALNSLGLRLNAIDRKTRPRVGGITIEHDEAGEPTGVIVDRNYPDVAQVDLLGAVPRFTPQDRKDGIRRAMRAYHACGTTSVYEGHGSAPEILDVYGELARANELTMRVALCISPTWLSLSEAEDQMRDLLSYARGRGLGDTHFRISGLFISFGGDPAAARVSLAHRENLGWSSYFKHANDADSFEALCLLAAKHDLRVHTVVIDKLHEVLLILARVNQRYDIRSKRWVLEHISAVREEDLPLLRDLGLGVTLIPGYHIAKAGARYAELGDAANLVAPALQMSALGIPVSSGTDNSPIDPLSVMQAMVTRREKSGRIIGAGGRVTREIALRTLTSGGWLTFEEHLKGTLSAGRVADLAVFDTDLLETPEDEIAASRCVATMVGGRLVHGLF